jgi:hypothetical protein
VAWSIGGGVGALGWGCRGGDSDVGALGWGQRGLVVAPRCWGGALGVVVCGVHSGGGGGVRKRKCGEDEI